MDRKIIASELIKIAKELLAASDYIYDPEQKKHPSVGYVKTEKGWTKNKKEQKSESKKEKKKKFDEDYLYDLAKDIRSKKI